MLLPHGLARWILASTAAVVFPGAAPGIASPLHTALKRSEPAADGRLETSPARVSLWFTAKPQLAFTAITIVSASGTIALDSIVADTGFALHARVPRTLEPGSYTVQWRTASADGHPIRGEFRFSIAGAAPDTTSRSAPLVAARPADLVPGETISEYRTARWMEFVALLTILGVIGFRHAVLPPLASRGVPTADAADRARRLGQAALVLYVAAVAVRLYAEAAALSTPASALTPAVLLPLLGGTIWGFGWSAGLAGAVLLFLGWTVSKKSTAIGTPLALTGALAIVLSPALSGHAASSPSFVLSVTFDMVHVAAAGLWLGGLVIVLVVGVPAMKRLTDGNPDAAVSALVNSFHPLALLCAPLVIVAGIGSSWLRLGDPGALTSTRYGQTLLWKLLLVALLVILGVWNSTRGRRRLGTGEATAQFRRSAALEVLIALLVLAATTQLVTAPLPSATLP